jgi:hypothetical protein
VLSEHLAPALVIAPPAPEELGMRRCAGCPEIQLASRINPVGIHGAHPSDFHWTVGQRCDRAMPGGTAVVAR